MVRDVVDNPYDPASSTNEPATLPLDEVIRRGVDAALLRMFKLRPAKIVKVKGSQRADIQVLLQGQYVGGQPFDLPTVQDALVWMPGGQDYYVKLPIAVGDVGLAAFADRSLDEWSVKGGSVCPQDGRTHHISDAIFFPGLNPFSAQIGDSTTDLVVKNGSAVLKVQKSGKFAITNGSAEALDKIISGFNTLASASTLAGGPFTPDVIAALNAVVSALTSLKGS